LELAPYCTVEGSRGRGVAVAVISRLSLRGNRGGTLSLHGMAWHGMAKSAVENREHTCTEIRERRVVSEMSLPIRDWRPRLNLHAPPARRGQDKVRPAVSWLSWELQMFSFAWLSSGPLKSCSAWPISAQVFDITSPTDVALKRPTHQRHRGWGCHAGAARAAEKETAWNMMWTTATPGPAVSPLQ
jgi:hypothetical protein